MQTRQERVVLETNRHRIAGTLTLARDGYRSRLSDVLNATERDFISLTDVTVEPTDAAGATTHHDFLAVSRHHVLLAVPDPNGTAEGNGFEAPAAGAG